VTAISIELDDVIIPQGNSDQKDYIQRPFNQIQMVEWEEVRDPRRNKRHRQREVAKQETEDK